MNRYKVVMEVDRAIARTSARWKMFVINRDGKAIPLLFRPMAAANAPLSVNHQGLSRGVTIAFNLPT